MHPVVYIHLYSNVLLDFPHDVKNFLLSCVDLMFIAEDDNLVTVDALRFWKVDLNVILVTDCNTTMANDVCMILGGKLVGFRDDSGALP